VELEEVDLFIFHQANRYMLDHLRKRMKLDPKKFFVYMEACGNTVSSTIPIALKAALSDGTLKPGALVLLAGFGVGYSWASTLVRWQ
jgi:3-oxoacyl-[acyl-carrier-protein] synthase-3